MIQSTRVSTDLSTVWTESPAMVVIQPVVVSFPPRKESLKALRQWFSRNRETVVAKAEKNTIRLTAKPRF